MKASKYEEIAKNRIHWIFEYDLKDPDTAWKRSFWMLSGVLGIALYDDDVNKKEYEDLSCSLHDHLETVYNKKTNKNHICNGRV